MSTLPTPSLLSSSLLRMGAALAVTISAACAGDAPTTPPPVVSAPPTGAPAPVPPAAGGLRSSSRNGDITIRIVTIDASGELSEESHKVLDDLLDQGWRSTGMTVVSATPPITLAVMLTMPPKRPPMQMRPGGPQFAPDNRQPPQPQMPPPTSGAPAPAQPAPPAPAPAPAGK